MTHAPLCSFCYCYLSNSVRHLFENISECALTWPLIARRTIVIIYPNNDWTLLKWVIFPYLFWVNTCDLTFIYTVLMANVSASRKRLRVVQGTTPCERVTLSLIQGRVTIGFKAIWLQGMYDIMFFGGKLTAIFCFSKLSFKLHHAI